MMKLPTIGMVLSALFFLNCAPAVVSHSPFRRPVYLAAAWNDPSGFGDGMVYFPFPSTLIPLF